MEAFDKFSALMDAFDCGITILDKEYNIVDHNHILKNMFGGMGRKCYSIYEGRKKICSNCPVEKAFGDGKPHRAMRSVSITNGEIEHWEYSSSPIKNDQGSIAACLEFRENISSRKKMEDELSQFRKSVERQRKDIVEANSALKIILGQREADKRELEEKILANIKMLISPCIEKLKHENNRNDQIKNIALLESGLKNIISSFSVRLLSKPIGLTPTEIKVASLLKNGYDSKEVAQALNISFETINCHRQKIRKKLGLNNRKINLRSFLLSLE